jgi:hypothetical protein
MVKTAQIRRQRGDELGSSGHEVVVAYVQSHYSEEDTVGDVRRGGDALRDAARITGERLGLRRPLRPTGHYVSIRPDGLRVLDEIVVRLGTWGAPPTGDHARVAEVLRRGLLEIGVDVVVRVDVAA